MLTLKLIKYLPILWAITKWSIRKKKKWNQQYYGEYYSLTSCSACLNKDSYLKMCAKLGQEAW